MDLFPFTKTRLSDVPFRPTDLGPERTPDDLRLNMLKVVFGWEQDIEDFGQSQEYVILPGQPLPYFCQSGSAILVLTSWLLWLDLSQ